MPTKPAVSPAPCRPSLFQHALAVRPADAALVTAAQCEIVHGPIATLRALHSLGLLDPPEVGSGQTWRRWRALAEVAAVDLSLGRLVEGHTDAIGIISEAGGQAEPGIYGVWAAGHDVTARDTGGEALLSGVRQYCSGASGVDRALVTAAIGDGESLFDIEVRQAGVRPVDGSWQAVGMAASDSATVEFSDALALSTLGPVDFYTARPGFWQGSLNVPACWYGGALGLARAAVDNAGDAPDAHKQADLGAIAIDILSMRQILQRAARDTDNEPGDCLGRAADRALAVRHAIFSGCERVLERAVRIGGTGALGHDSAQARRVADLTVYLRQHHPGPDLARAGQSLLGLPR